MRADSLLLRPLSRKTGFAATSTPSGAPNARTGRNADFVEIMWHSEMIAVKST